MNTGFLRELWRELHNKFAPYKEFYLHSYPPLLVDTTRELLRIKPGRPRRDWWLLVTQFAVLLAIPLFPIVLPVASGMERFHELVGNELAFAAGLTLWPLAIFVTSSDERIWTMGSREGERPGVNLALHVGLIITGLLIGLADKSVAAQPSEVARGAGWGITLAAFADLACLAATLVIAFYRPLFSERR